MDTRKVRLATIADASAIVEIYNQGIAERIATFETEPRTVHQIEAQLMEKGDRYPTIVVEQDGQVVAWATAGPYRSRPVYAGVAEHSVYVERHARGTGAGRAALESLTTTMSHCHPHGRFIQKGQQSFADMSGISRQTVTMLPCAFPCLVVTFFKVCLVSHPGGR